MIITQTPLRLSLFGGNTDFREYFQKHGGKVFTASIDKYIYCIVKKRFDDLIIVNYSQREVVPRVNNLKHGIVREALRLVGIEKGIEISFMADIPSRGTGLGSSSSVAVGVLNALHTYNGENVSAKRLAEEACQIEIDILKNPIGVQDQYAVAFGGLRVFYFEHDGVESGELNMEESWKEDFNNSLMLFYTGETRKTNEVLADFDVASSTETLHIKKEMVSEGVDCLMSGDLKGFGKLLGNSWATKRVANTKTTSREIDLMYERVIEAGAIGGKVIGAGGGGFLLVMFSANKRAVIREAMKDYKEMPFRFTDSGSKVIFNI